MELEKQFYSKQKSENCRRKVKNYIEVIEILINLRA